MRKAVLAFLLLSLVPGPRPSAADQATPEDELAKKFPVVSVYYSVPDSDQGNFTDVVFRFAWTKKKPAQIAVEFANRSYSDHSLKFAIKDVTAKKMVVLDPVRHSNFGSETLKSNSVGAVWSGPVKNINDEFSLHVWNSAGDEFDKVPISIKDQQ